MPIGVTLNTKVNRSNDKLMAISVKYLNDNFLAEEKFLELIEINKKDAQTIH